MSSKKIIIIGGTGAIGSSLAKELKKLNYEPVLIARNKNDLEKISKVNKLRTLFCNVMF